MAEVQEEINRVIAIGREKGPEHVLLFVEDRVHLTGEGPDLVATTEEDPARGLATATDAREEVSALPCLQRSRSR